MTMSYEKWAKKRAARTLRAERLAAARAKGTHSAKQWDRIVAKYDGRCVRCGYRGPDGWRPTKDHIRAISDGGSDAARNLQPLCRECNTANKSRMNWRRYMDEFGWADASHYNE